MSRPGELLEQVRTAIRAKHYSYRTEKTYVQWIRRFILFHGKRHPASMGEPEVRAFLNDLAVRAQVAASTQNQALAAILVLYGIVLRRELPWVEDIIRAKRPSHLPVVLSRDEVQAIFAQIDGMKRLMVGLLYGAGLRLTECVSLRVKDIDLTYGQIIVRDGKGQRDRATILPAALLPEFQAHLARVKILHDREVALGYGFAPLPFALARKYPAADREWAWQFVFPASRRCIDPRTRKTVRFHIAESTLQRTVKAAVRRIAVSSDRVSSIRMNSFSG